MVLRMVLCWWAFRRWAWLSCSLSWCGHRGLGQFVTGHTGRRSSAVVGAGGSWCVRRATDLQRGIVGNAVVVEPHPRVSGGIGGHYRASVVVAGRLRQRVDEGEEGIIG